MGKYAIKIKKEYKQDPNIFDEENKKLKKKNNITQTKYIKKNCFIIVYFL